MKNPVTDHDLKVMCPQLERQFHLIKHIKNIADNLDRWIMEDLKQIFDSAMDSGYTPRMIMDQRGKPLFMANDGEVFLNEIKKMIGYSSTIERKLKPMEDLKC